MISTKAPGAMRLIRCVLFAVICFSFVACDSMLNLQPKGSPSAATFWETEKDLTVAVNGTYQVMLDGSRNITFGLFGMLDGFTPIGYFREGVHNQIALGIYEPTSSVVANRWATCYRGIVRANDVLAHVGGMEIDASIKKKRKGEALFLRAWYYFNLVYFFGDVPLILDVPTLEDVTSVRRTPTQKVVEQMLADLNEAIGLLPESWEQKGRATKGAALTLKAKILMQEHRYQEAVPVLEQVMQMGYVLFPSYTGLFADENEHHSGVIWTLEYMSGSGLGLGNPFDKMYSTRETGPVGVGGWDWLVPTIDLVKMYENVGPDGPNPVGVPDPDPNCEVLAVDCSLFVNKDPRLYYTILYPGSKFVNYHGEMLKYPEGLGGNYAHTQTGMNLRKLITLGANNIDNYDSPQDWIFFRYADVLLLYAEAKVEAGQIDASVYEAINAVRGRVNMPPIEPGKTAAELRKIIHRERTVELAFEGWHFFDLKRWDLMKEKIDGDPVINVSNGVEVATRRFVAPKHLLWPIPLSEIQRNPNLKQNPGWN